MLGLQPDSCSSQTSTLELVQSHAVRWLHSCDAASKVTAPRQLFAGAHIPEQQLEKRWQLWPAPGLPLLCLGKADIITLSTQELHSEEETPLLERFLPSRGRQEGPCLATAHEKKLWLPKQTVKQMVCYVHLLYLWLCIIMITGWLPWTVQAVKGGQLCFTTLFHTKQIQRSPIA